ncbi:hypothetical protein FPV67DRAFT_1562583 [Lyophyllum atratum]|nr:hypothetical protein FPV67DRAFT_1562583 [Lyophyllum atratum]
MSPSLHSAGSGGSGLLRLGPGVDEEHELPSPPHVIDLVSVDDSKRIHVSLYSGRAELTRLYKFPIKIGQNQVNINGLPNHENAYAVDVECIVEGRGAATIHDVTLSDMPQAPVPSTSEHLLELTSEKELAKKLVRAMKGMTSLQAYLSTFNVQHTDVATLDKVIKHYDASGSRLDKKILDLEKKITKLRDEIKEEQDRTAGAPRNGSSVSERQLGEVAIALIYAVKAATWSAGYDVRVDTQTKEKPATLIYKAGITQDTGESWDAVPLTLETASPTSGVDIPTLLPGIYQSIDPPRMGVESDDHGALALEYDEDVGGVREHRGSTVTSKGGISATFQVPGSVTVPSDVAAHNVTVAELKLDASMSWMTVPKVDAKTHLKAKIKNASDYTLLRGVASVYVDGSFIAPGQTCPLLNHSIRVIYHPRAKKVSHSGSYSKTSNHVFSQRITVIEQLPVSENSQITVTLLSPGFVLPDQTSNSISKGAELRVPSPVKVGDGVWAQWEGANEPDVDVEALGRDGKFNWVCAVPAQGKIILLLSWEVAAPLRTQIVGL